MAYFLTDSCTIGNINGITQLQNKQIPIGGSDVGSYNTFQLINNKYIAMYQADDAFGISGGNTTVYVYDLLLRLVNTFPVTGQFVATSGFRDNQGYSNDITYFKAAQGSAWVILKVNLYTKESSVISFTVTGHPEYYITEVSNVDSTGTYVAVTFQGTTSRDTYLFNISTSIITSVLLKSDSISIIDPVPFIYGSNVYLFSNTATLGILGKYSLVGH